MFLNSFPRLQPTAAPFTFLSFYGAGRPCPLPMCCSCWWRAIDGLIVIDTFLPRSPKFLVSGGRLSTSPPSNIFKWHLYPPCCATSTFYLAPPPAACPRLRVGRTLDIFYQSHNLIHIQAEHKLSRYRRHLGPRFLLFWLGSFLRRTRPPSCWYTQAAVVCRPTLAEEAID